MRVIPPAVDHEIDRIAERLRNPTAEDLAQWERFGRMRVLIANARDDLGPMNERQRQLLGLYMLQACWLGQGRDYEERPTLEVAKPALTVVR
jgi:hypothetical protein